MDENPKIFARKQRQKNQRYHARKAPQKQDEPASANPVIDNNGSDPLPQRANRRQRSEAVAPPGNSVGDSTPVPNKDNNDTTEKGNVTIDFSNLKRETEEIAKLTKKFAKRNISSNWHRYSAPEGNEDGERTDEEGPADFSALIQVPTSKGGHLQLKEEQEWSSASGEQLGGYFALNLKLLSQSLACVPLHEQLRLPKHVFSEEELKRFDSLASQAAKAYNSDKIEDPNSKVMKTLTSLLQRESDIVEEPEAKNDQHIDYTFNTLDIQGSNQKFLNIESEPEISLENTQPDNSDVRNSNRDSSEKDHLSFNSISYEIENPIQLRKEECSVNDRLLKGTDHNNLSISNSLKENETFKTENIDSIEEKSSNFIKTKSKKHEELNELLSQSSTKHKMTVGVDRVIENTHTGILHMNSDIKKESPTREIKLTNNYNPETIIMSEPKERRTNNRKKSINDANENKPNNKENNIKLEDDDDLDFLLSLKNPILPQKKKESKPVANKDSTFLPGNGPSSHTSSTVPHSELDDWLDSVLQD